MQFVYYSLLCTVLLLSGRATGAPQLTHIYALPGPLESSQKLNTVGYATGYNSPSVYAISSNNLQGNAVPVTLVSNGHSAGAQGVALQPTLYLQSAGLPVSSGALNSGKYSFGTPAYLIQSAPQSYAAAAPSYVTYGLYGTGGGQSYIIGDQANLQGSGQYTTGLSSYNTQESSSAALDDRSAFEAAQRVSQQASAQRAAEEAASRAEQQAAAQRAAQQAAAQRAAEQAAAQRAADQAAAAQRAAQQAAANQAAQQAAAQRAAEQAAAQRAAQEAAAQQAAAQRAAEQAAAQRAAQEAAAQRAADQAAAAQRAAQQAAAQHAAQQAAAQSAAQIAAAQRAAQQAAALRAEQEAAALRLEQAAQVAANQRAAQEAAQREAAQKASAEYQNSQYNTDTSGALYNFGQQSTSGYTGSLSGYQGTVNDNRAGYTSGNIGYGTGYTDVANRFGSGSYDLGNGNHYSGYKTSGNSGYGSTYSGGYGTGYGSGYSGQYGSYYGIPSSGYSGGATYLQTGSGSSGFQNSAANAYTLRQSQDSGYDGSFQYSFETDNGINVHAEGSLRNAGTADEIQVITGSYSYVTPDGKHHTVHYVADENGFHARGEDLPLRKRSLAQDLLKAIKNEVEKHEHV